LNSNDEEEDLMPHLWTWLALAFDWYTPERVIALATIAYVLVTTIMLVAIRAQAKAAQTSADSLKRLERPWILVRPIENNSETPSWIAGTGWVKPGTILVGPVGRPFATVIPYTDDELKSEGFRVRLGYTIKNYGRSPGHMTYHWANVAIVDAEGAMPELPDYTAKKPSFDLPDTRLMEPRGAFKNYVPIRFRDFKDMWERKKFLYLYGYITYRDIWGAEHKTGFGFYYHVENPPFDLDPRGFFPEPQTYNYET
jgi:hypothetical protein